MKTRNASENVSLQLQQLIAPAASHSPFAVTCNRSCAKQVGNTRHDWQLSPARDWVCCVWGRDLWDAVKELMSFATSTSACVGVQAAWLLDCASVWRRAAPNVVLSVSSVLRPFV